VCDVLNGITSHLQNDIVVNVLW